MSIPPATSDYERPSGSPIYNVFLGDLSQARMTSPIHSTGEVPTIINSQSLMLIGVTLKACPPTLTISICPTMMTKAIRIKLLLSGNLNIDLFVAKARALNMFQNCKKTKMEKNNDNS